MRHSFHVEYARQVVDEALKELLLPPEAFPYVVKVTEVDAVRQRQAYTPSGFHVGTAISVHREVESVCVVCTTFPPTKNNATGARIHLPSEGTPDTRSYDLGRLMGYIRWALGNKEKTEETQA